MYIYWHWGKPLEVAKSYALVDWLIVLINICESIYSWIKNIWTCISLLDRFFFLLRQRTSISKYCSICYAIHVVDWCALVQLIYHDNDREIVCVHVCNLEWSTESWCDFIHFYTECDCSIMYYVCTWTLHLKDDMAREIHSKLWPKSNMTKLLKFVPSRIGLLLSQNNYEILWKCSLVYKDKPTNYFSTNNERVSVNCKKLWHATFEAQFVNFIDEWFPSSSCLSGKLCSWPEHRNSNLSSAVQSYSKFAKHVSFNLYCMHT